MHANSFFSIIIPTYNSEVTISRALDSVLKQSYKDYEILIMDGISTDNTKSIVETYQRTHDTIKMFSEKDTGIYDAMNKGIERSKGDWLYFLGSDDYFFNHQVLMSVANALNDTSYDVIYGNVFFTAKNTLYDGEFNYVKLMQRNICHQAIFLKKTVFDKIGNFELTYTSVADWHHNIKWFYNDDIKHRFIDLIVADYSDGGYSSHNRDQNFLDAKSEIFLKYGFFKLPTQNLIAITTKIVKKQKKQKSYFKFLTYGFLLFCLKVKKKIKTT